MTRSDPFPFIPILTKSENHFAFCELCALTYPTQYAHNIYTLEFLECVATQLVLCLQSRERQGTDQE